jgi:hypothetical protein
MFDALRIRREQMHALAQPAIPGLADEISYDLISRRVPSAQCIPEALLRSRVEWGIHQALHLGLFEQASIRVFVNLLFEIDPGYYGHPEAERILFGTVSTDREKVRELLAWLHEASWLRSLDLFARPEWPCE